MTDQEMLKEIYEGMHKLQTVVERVENDVKRVEHDVQEVKHDVQEVKHDVQEVKHDVQSSKKEINGIQLTLENVTNRNINIIAEAHSDLSRKLDEAVRIDSEKELLMIRVNILENEVRKLKETVENIA